MSSAMTNSNLTINVDLEERVGRGRETGPFLLGGSKLMLKLLLVILWDLLLFLVH